MQKNVLIFVLLVFALTFLFGCVCPPNDWSGPWPPWCEKGSSWDRPSVPNGVDSSGVNSDLNSFDSNILAPSAPTPINPVEKIIDIVTPSKTEYDTTPFVPKKLEYLLENPPASKKNLIMGVGMHDVYGKFCIGEPTICEENTSKEVLEASMKRINAIGGELVLVTDFAQLKVDGTMQRPPVWAGARELSDSELNNIIKEANKNNLKTILITNLYAGENGARDYVDYENASKEKINGLFNEWEKIILENATKAQSAGMDYLIINSRDIQLDYFKDVETSNIAYEKLLLKVREKFSGKICSWGNIWNLTTLKYTSKVDCVVEDTGVSGLLKNTKEEVNAIEKVWKEHFSDNKFKQFENKEIFVLLLMPSYDGAMNYGWIEPDKSYPDGEYQSDFKEQALVYEGLFSAINNTDLNISGIISYGYWWHNTLHNPISHGNSLGQSIRNKDAEQVFYNWAN